MFKTFREAFKIKDVRRKLLLTLLLLLIYRIGCWIPTPGIIPSAFADATSEGFLSIINAVNGSALSNGSLLALGVLPYINASIIIQLLSIAIPKLEKISKQGEDGKKKIALYTRIAALCLAIAQAVGIVVAFGSSSLDTTIFGGKWFTATMVVVILVAGAMFTVWLGERITELAIGNGMSLLIYVGIISSAGFAIFNAISNIGSNINYLWTLLIFLLAVIVIFALIVWVDLAERKIPVQYAKQIKGRKMYGGQSTHIPIKVNSSGVMPIIFAMSLISFPQLIMSIFGSQDKYPAILATGGWLYSLIVAVLIFFFSYFYSQISFNPEDVSRQIQQNGGFIPGIRAGKPTAEYLGRVSKRITFFGAIFLTFIALVPTLIFTFVSGGDAGLINAFSATGLIIVVSTALEFNKQLEAQLLMRNYKGFLK